MLFRTRAVMNAHARRLTRLSRDLFYITCQIRQGWSAASSTPNFCFEFRACSLLAPSNSELSARSHPRFGARYTSKALADLGLSTSDPSWRPMAQQLTRQALRTRKWQRKNAGVWPARASAQMLVVWCSYEIYDESGLVCENKGKLFFAAKTDATEVDSARGLSELLLASVFVEHDRSMHAERHALLEVANLVERMGSRDVHGNVRLYAVHTPCISCLAVFCQFRSLFPQVVLHVQFDDWSATRQALVEMGGRHASFASPAGIVGVECLSVGYRACTKGSPDGGCE